MSLDLIVTEYTPADKLPSSIKLEVNLPFSINPVPETLSLIIKLTLPLKSLPNSVPFTSPIIVTDDSLP